MPDSVEHSEHPKSVREAERAANPDAPPQPADYLCDECGCREAWLVDGAMLSDIIEDVWDHLDDSTFEIVRAYYRLRWTTPEELADEDKLYDLFGDHEMSGIDTSVVYEEVTKDHEDDPDVHLFVRFEAVKETADA
ncbi:MAG TPA: hypothetical protein VGF95_14600 [Solirubrobacteraceae bacterium]|jgi:hypothetical protein